MKTVAILFFSIAALFAAYLMLQHEDVDVATSPAATSRTAADVILPAAENALVKPPSALFTEDSSAINAGNNSQVGHTQEKSLEPEISEAVRKLVNTSHEGLVEEQRADGVEVNLKGRFRTAPVATINEQGEVTVRDYTSVPVE